MLVRKASRRHGAPSPLPRRASRPRRSGSRRSSCTRGTRAGTRPRARAPSRSTRQRRSSSTTPPTAPGSLRWRSSATSTLAYRTPPTTCSRNASPRSRAARWRLPRRPARRRSSSPSPPSWRPGRTSCSRPTSMVARASSSKLLCPGSASKFADSVSAEDQAQIDDDMRALYVESRPSFNVPDLMLSQSLRGATRSACRQHEPAELTASQSGTVLTSSLSRPPSGSAATATLSAV